MSDSSSERFTFRVKSVAVLLTFRDCVVPHDKYVSYCLANDISISSYVIEKHRSGNEHTHIVLVSAYPRLYECGYFHGEFGNYPNMKRLRTTNDAYKAIAYCSKEKTAELMVQPPFSDKVTKDYILGHVWDYAMRSRTKDTTATLMAQYKRMKDEWLPANYQADPYDSSNVVSENPSPFFP